MGPMIDRTEGRVLSRAGFAERKLMVEVWDVVARARAQATWPIT